MASPQQSSIRGVLDDVLDRHVADEHGLARGQRPDGVGGRAVGNRLGGDPKSRVGRQPFGDCELHAHRAGNRLADHLVVRRELLAERGVEGLDDLFEILLLLAREHPLRIGPDRHRLEQDLVVAGPVGPGGLVHLEGFVLRLAGHQQRAVLAKEPRGLNASRLAARGASGERRHGGEETDRKPFHDRAPSAVGDSISPTSRRRR
jgi:hypothetical protein